MNKPDWYKETYNVYYGSSFCGKTTAVSEEEAINNIRYQLFKKNNYCWIGVPYMSDPAWSAKIK